MNAIVSVSQLSKINIITEISDNDLESVKDAIVDIHKYAEFDLSWKTCLSNSLKLSKHCQGLLTTQISTTSLSDSNETSLRYNFSKLVMNFISSYYNFLSFCQYNSKRWFGIIGTKKTTEIISSFYDENYFYKFLYKFRNYITHQGLPIHAVFLRERKVNFILLPEKLVDDYDSWGKDLKDELNKIDGHINLVTLFSKCNISASVLAKELHDYYLSEISASVSLISSLVIDFLKDDCSYKLIISSAPFTEENFNEGIALELIPIPLIVFSN